MKKRLIYLILVVNSFSTFLAAQTDYSKMPKMRKEWREIHKLDAAGKKESALKQLDILLSEVQAQGNWPQILAAVDYKAQLLIDLRDDDGYAAYAFLHEERVKAPQGLNTLLTVREAEYLSALSSQYSWRNSTDGDPKDVKTWRTEQFTDSLNALYKAVWADKSLLNVSSKGFWEAATDAAARAYIYSDKPTLYDLALEKVIAHTLNDYNNNALGFDTEGAFAEAAVFAEAPHAAFLPQVWADKLRRLSLLSDKQGWLKVNLARLSHALTYSKLPNRQALYEAALLKLYQTHENNVLQAEIALTLVGFYRGLSVEQALELGYDPKDMAKKAYELAKKAADAYPRSYFISDLKFQLAELLEIILSLQIEAVQMPNQPILARINIKNVEQAYLKIYKSTGDMRTTYDAGRLAKSLAQEKPVQTQVIALPFKRDYNIHSALFKIEALAEGTYWAIVTTTPDLKNTKATDFRVTSFQVSNLAIHHRFSGDPNTSKIVVVNRTTGAPLAGVTAVFKGDNKFETARQSDEKGVFTLDFDTRGVHTSFFSLGKDTLYNMLSGYYYSYDRTPQTAEDALVFTDRQLYRPGQKVYFKVIQYEMLGKNNYKTLRDKAVEVALRDVNGQIVAQKTLSTNEFGSVEGDFTLPTSGLTGQMSIGTIHAAAYFRMEEYKRPKFEVTFDTYTETPILGQAVSVKGRATAYSGAKIDGAAGRFTVKRRLRPLFEPYYFASRRYAALEKEVAVGTFTTDAEGQFTVTFTASPDSTQVLEGSTIYEYIVSAQVTDLNGETQSAEKTYQVGPKALYVSLDMPAVLEKPKPVALTLATANAQGTPISAAVQVTIWRLKHPEGYKNKSLLDMADTCLLSETAFKQHFPHWQLTALDKSSWPVAEQVFGQLVRIKAEKGAYLETSNVILPESKNNWPAGAYQVVITAKDSLTGTPLEVKHYFEIYDAADTYVPDQKMVYATLDKDSYQAGETAVLTMTPAVKNLWVYIEVEKEGRIVQAEWQQLAASQPFKMPVLAGDAGNFFCHLSYFWQNRGDHFTKVVTVPLTNKKLSIQYGSFRDKLAPGAPETWTLTVTGEGKEAVAAELLATLYDASLDALAGPHALSFWPYANNYALRELSVSRTSDIEASYWYYRQTVQQRPVKRPIMRFVPARARAAQSERMMSKTVTLAAPPPAAMAFDAAGDNNVQLDSVVSPEPVAALTAAPPPPMRTNLNELVFFKPQLRTDENGNITFSFTMNEALTKWRFLAFAHTPDLSIGTSSKTVVTQKELMVVPNLPRFFREGDTMVLSTKIINLSATPLSTRAILALADAPTNKLLSDWYLETREKVVTVPAGGSAVVSWRLRVPTATAQAVVCRISAQTEGFSDGEETVLPVLTNRLLVTESLPLRILPGETRTFELKSLTQKIKSGTLVPQQATLEMTQNPAWYALQALPYLMEYPFECSEQLFSRFYANSLAAHILTKNPMIKSVFDQWRSTDSTAFLSKLMQNEALKSALLAETPWVLAAQDEATQRKNWALLFDLAKMSAQSQSVAQKLSERQLPDGGFPWFNGGESNWYITQHIVEGLGRLRQLGVLTLENRTPIWQAILGQAQGYTDKKALEAYEDLLKVEKEGKIKLSDNHLTALWIHYAHSQSLFPDRKLTNKGLKGFLTAQMKAYWLSRSVYEQALIALTLLRTGHEKEAKEMAASLRERAIKNPELGYYYKNNRSFYWSEAPIETQTAVIELFDAIGDTETVMALNTWLIQSKQTQHWGTTKATTAAIFALLKTDAAVFDTVQKVAITWGNKAVDTQNAQAGTGYIQKTVVGKAITPELGKVKVSNPRKNVVLGGLYWQYFEDLDKVKGQYEALPLSVSKLLFYQTTQGRQTVFMPVTDKTALRIGDRIRVQLTLKVDRNMEFVHLKDMRAAALEPTTTLSGYKFQAGIGYYQSTRDAATDFFFEVLNRGTYVLEYELVVAQQGSFSNGLTTLQCLYAPEFSSHTAGQRLKF